MDEGAHPALTGEPRLSATEGMELVVKYIVRYEEIEVTEVEADRALVTANALELYSSRGALVAAFRAWDSLGSVTA